MSADPILYCLENLTDYSHFERLCHDLMAATGYPDIEPLGGFHDKGRDAIHHSRSGGEETIFAYSVREDWKVKLDEDARTVGAHGHRCDRLIFVTTASPTAGERDAAKQSIHLKFGWQLDLYGAERLRVLLTTSQRDLIAKHPQIFTPALFPIQTRRGPHVQVRASATRNGWRQLAQIQMFNAGDAPIFISGWNARWDVDGQPKLIHSRETIQGLFPRRLVEQDGYSVLIPLDQYSIADLKALELVDAAGNSWPVSEAGLNAMIATAKAFAPNVSRERGGSKLDLSQAQVAFDWTRKPLGGKQIDSFELRLKNNSDLNIPLSGARLEWEYDPPKVLGDSNSELKCWEQGGSISLRPSTATDSPIAPGSRAIFTIAAEMASAITPVLGDDVKADAIKCIITVKGGGAWKFADPRFGDDVRAFARSVIASWPI